MGCREARNGCIFSKQSSSSYLCSHPVHLRLEQMRFTYIVVGYGTSKNRPWDWCKHTYEDEAELRFDYVDLHDLHYVRKSPELKASGTEEEDSDRECDQTVHRVSD